MWPSLVTTVSALTTRHSARGTPVCERTASKDVAQEKRALPLARDERRAKAAGCSPASGCGSAFSGAGTTTKESPVLLNNSLRRGEAEARIQGLREEKMANLHYFHVRAIRFAKVFLQWRGYWVHKSHLLSELLR